MDYERQRQAAADRIGVRTSILDKLVAAKRPKNSDEAGESVMFPEVEPWPEPVNGARLLDDLAASARRFIVLPKHGDTALALWVLFTYLIDAVNVAPIMALASPEKRCGKTTALAWLSRLIYRVLPASNITPAALFRAVEAWKPTLLIDEADSFLRENEELRGVLNSGHTRATAYVIRTVGEDFEPRRFSTWGAKAVALIGHLPDTLHDRSIVLDMRRKLPGERVEKLRYANDAEFEELAGKCIRFAKDCAERVGAVRITLPDGLNDRAADNWEPLFAIAEAAGGDWPERARAAALVLSGAEQEAPSLNVELLADIRKAFEIEGTDRLSGAELVKILCADAERPWATFARGKELTQAKLARRLRGFGVLSKSIRLPDGDRLKGYERDQFTEAFERYVCAQPADTSFQSVTAGQPNNDAGFSDFPKRDSYDVSRIENTPKAAPVLDCPAVTLSNGVNGQNDEEGIEI
jgi:putative DNA primase/helicase